MGQTAGLKADRMVVQREGRLEVLTVVLTVVRREDRLEDQKVDHSVGLMEDRSVDQTEDRSAGPREGRLVDHLVDLRVAPKEGLMAVRLVGPQDLLEVRAALHRFARLVLVQARLQALRALVVLGLEWVFV